MRITDLEKNLGKFSLSIDDLYIEPGKIHGLTGHNGCGKSVLLKIIMGIMEADKGTVDMEGLPMDKVTLMSQRPYMLHDTVYENLIYPLKIRGHKTDSHYADSLLKRVGLWEMRNQYAGSLSSGERQKLSFLRAIIFKPEFIMMDETLSNLDPDSEKIIVDLIKELQAQRPVTWLIVSHQLEYKEGLVDVLHKMEKGKYCGIIKG